MVGNDKLTSMIGVGGCGLDIAGGGSGIVGGELDTIGSMLV